jgi:hypothetical protein
MITISIIFTIFYLKYLRRFIITYRRKKDNDEDIDYWIECELAPIEKATLVVSVVLAVILAIILIILAITYLP